MADKEWGENKKKTGSSKSGRASQWKENGGCFHTERLGGGKGRLLMSFSPVNVNLVDYLG